MKLDSTWDGIKAHGRGYLDIYDGKEAEWHISCLFDTVPEDGSNSIGNDVVHVLSLRVGSAVDVVQPGFTISYKQKARPAILRFKSYRHFLNFGNRPESTPLWRTPSVEFDPDILENARGNTRPVMHGSLGQQKSLGEYLHGLQVSIKEELHDVIKHFCPKSKGQPKGHVPVAIPSDQFLGIAPDTHDEPILSHDTVDSTSTISNYPAAETRSLSTLDSSDPSATPASTSSSPPQTSLDLHFLKIFALVLILGSCLSWICLRCRDPRRRAECLARREERRNRKLYRRAARQHKIKMWVWNFRLRYGLVPREVFSWDEKRARVIQQEAILEDALTDNIRALRNANRVVSTVTAAEEGRNGFVYESDGSDRRRSVTTLPGYESEGSQPPTYDEIESSLEGTTVVNGFRYTPGDAEFRSDSSVISTSPRISRDGTNSDFDEKIDPISLDPTRPTAKDFDREV